ncbi:MAG: hypothetical protein JO154_12535 [Chitinophaga sp.]|uniref:hypothetical protein n=1 Tax=Chitinophaga sp. TaxID=1869181 RepID=UPI0025B9560A|nr:hypothetical protein [Chitinophaga sp.]MBV8253426.1 hypothetical protein [Chitinophaga sp.]
MKPISYFFILAGTLALGACSSAYRTTGTPDDVYYSPRQQQNPAYAGNYSNGNSRQDDNTYSTVPAADDDGGTYVTYSDEQGDYERRLDRFGSGGSSYRGSYMDGYYDGMYANSFNYGMSYGMGYGYPYSSFGYGYSPFWGSSMGLSLGWGLGGFYSPWSYGYYGGGWGYPYYAYNPYYYPYYAGGYYGHGYYGGGYGGGYYSRSTYGPVYNRVNNNYNRPVRSGGMAGGSTPRPDRGGYQPIGNNTGYGRPSRVSYQPTNNNGGGYTAPANTERPRRVFQQSSGERPVYQPSNNSSRPSRVEYSRPQQSQPSYSQPSYSQPSYSAPSGGGGRVGGGGGGGGSRPSRGGR